jgi:hypothetical protein
MCWIKKFNTTIYSEGYKLNYPGLQAGGSLAAKYRAGFSLKKNAKFLISHIDRRFLAKALYLCIYADPRPEVRGNSMTPYPL